MRTFVLTTMLLLAASVHAKELKPLPERGRAFDGKAWTEYSIETLNLLFPQHEETVLYFRFLFVDEAIPNVMTLKEDQHFVVWISSGLINSLESEHEYAYILGHEIGHVVLGHPFYRDRWRKMTLDVSHPELWARVTAEELEAELFAGRSVPNGFCAGATLTRRELLRAFVNPHPREEWQVQQRIELLERMCAFIRQNEEER